MMRKSMQEIKLLARLGAKTTLAMPVSRIFSFHKVQYIIFEISLRFLSSLPINLL